MNHYGCVHQRISISRFFFGFTSGTHSLFVYPSNRLKAFEVCASTLANRFTYQIYYEYRFTYQSILQGLIENKEECLRPLKWRELVHMLNDCSCKLF